VYSSGASTGTPLLSATVSERYFRKNASERLFGKMKHILLISPKAYQYSATCLKKAFMLQIYLKLVPTWQYKQKFFSCLLLARNAHFLICETMILF